MPFCIWCRKFIEKGQERWRCKNCRSIFCTSCAIGELKEVCPFCKEEKMLAREAPIVW